MMRRVCSPAVPVMSTTAAASMTAPTSSPMASEQRRTGLNYAKHRFKETRQPKWLHEKRFGTNMSYHSRSPRKGMSPPTYQIHQDYWGDTEMDRNPAYQKYGSMQQTVNMLKGRQASPFSSDPHQSEGMTDRELHLDLRFMGAYRPAATNLFYEKQWNVLLYPNQQAASQAGLIGVRDEENATTPWSKMTKASNKKKSSASASKMDQLTNKERLRMEQQAAVDALTQPTTQRADVIRPATGGKGQGVNRLTSARQEQLKLQQQEYRRKVKEESMQAGGMKFSVASKKGGAVKGELDPAAISLSPTVSTPSGFPLLFPGAVAAAPKSAGKAMASKKATTESSVPALSPSELQRQALSIQQQTSLQDVKAWWGKLAYLVNLHRLGVGEIAPGKNRNIRHVHATFLQFENAITSFDFQDAQLTNALWDTRPKELEDIFGLFLEMEANHIHEAYCPRCSLPYHGTSFCGEGDRTTEFRKFRGRDAPHQQWGAEWYEVIANRAEQLWYRAAEDPLFGSYEGRHTQKQAEGLLTVYCKTQQRGRANTFLASLQGMKEYLSGEIQITPHMTQMYESLLDSTPHPHLLTPAVVISPNSGSKFGGEANVIPQSPQQLRLDLEVMKMRREQKEEGVVRVPPETWQVDLAGIDNYKAGAPPRPALPSLPATSQGPSATSKVVTNWRDVKKSLERSFLSSGLPDQLYTPMERREMKWLEEKVARVDIERGRLQATLIKELEAITGLKNTPTNTNGAKPPTTESATTTEATSTGTSLVNVNPALMNTALLRSKQCVVFPDAHYYRVFDISPAALQPFCGGALGHGTSIVCKARVFKTPDEVSVTIGGRTMRLDVRDATCSLYGFTTGSCVQVEPTSGAAFKVFVLGVDQTGPGEKWNLVGYRADQPDVLVDLGKDVQEVRAKWKSIASQSTNHLLCSAFNQAFNGVEWFEGCIVGVRDGVLYAQWQGKGVAVPMGRKEVVGELWKVEVFSEQKMSSSAAAAASSASVIQSANDQAQAYTLQEPFSWDVPFRNVSYEQQLQSLKARPWKKEEYVPLTPNRVTPKVKVFGYTQHIKQDDFVTAEYQGRLTSKQVFQEPQKFQVIPDKSDRSVHDNKDHFLVTHGLPSVDRRELSQGWQEDHTVLSDVEVSVVEQALKDISGRRPGNFVKSLDEKASLRLNESWFEENAWGWDRREAVESEGAMVQHPASEGSSVWTAKKSLPFGGRLPVFNTTHGIGERLREVTEQFAQSFDLGPHGHSMGANGFDYDTGGLCSADAKRAIGEGILQRMFRMKLAKDGYQLNELPEWFSAMASGSPSDRPSGAVDPLWTAPGVNTTPLAASSSSVTFTSVASLGGLLSAIDPKDFIIAVNEWQQMGRAPTLLLRKVLQTYLHDEINTYNASIPAGVPKLTVDTATGMITTQDQPSILADVDRIEQKLALGAMKVLPQSVLVGAQGSGASGGGTSGAAGADGASSYVTSCFLTNTLEGQLDILGQDQEAVATVKQQLASILMSGLTELIGKQITSDKMVSYRGKSQEGKKEGGGGGGAAGSNNGPNTIPPQLIRSTVLQEYLTQKGFSGEQWSLLRRGLHAWVMVDTQNPDVLESDFLVPFEAIVAWNGLTQSSRSSGARRDMQGAAMAQSAVQGGAAGSSSTIASGLTTLPTGRALLIPEVLDAMSVFQDGLALDYIYRAQKNIQSEEQRAAFFEFVGPVVRKAFKDAAPNSDGPAQVLQVRFEEYCRGQWSPRADEAVEMITAYCEWYQLVSKQASTGAPTGALNVGPTATTTAAMNQQQGPHHITLVHNVAGHVTGVVPAPPSALPFQFDNVGLEHYNTVARAREFMLPIVAETRGDPVPLLPAKGEESSGHPPNAMTFTTSTKAVYLTADRLYGLDVKLRELDAAGPFGSFRSTSTNAVGSMAQFANNLLRRALPLLDQWQPLLSSYDAKVASHTSVVQRNKNSLSLILKKSSDAQLQADFRQNAERYWRRVLDGRGNEEGGNAGGGGGRGGRKQQNLAATREETSRMLDQATRQAQGRGGGGRGSGSAPNRGGVTGMLRDGGSVRGRGRGGNMQ